MRSSGPRGSSAETQQAVLAGQEVPEKAWGARVMHPYPEDRALRAHSKDNGRGRVVLVSRDLSFLILMTTVLGNPARKTRRDQWTRDHFG